MNILSIFVLIPLLMLLGLWLSRNIKQIRTVMVTGASALVLAAVGLTLLICKRVLPETQPKCSSVRMYPGIRHSTYTTPWE